jgi:hypothetical protein
MSALIADIHLTADSCVVKSPASRTATVVSHIKSHYKTVISQSLRYTSPSKAIIHARLSEFLTLLNGFKSWNSQNFIHNLSNLTLCTTEKSW